MAFSPTPYNEPDLSTPALREAPKARFEPAPADGVAPDNFHATSIFPEYFKLDDGGWHILTQSRMDCVAVLRRENELEVVEARRLQKGDLVALGRAENGEDGIFVHDAPFNAVKSCEEKFAFRTRVTRESSFSIDYDELYDLLRYERDHGYIVWVMGPAVVFDSDARNSMAWLIEDGFVHALMAGNALAAHDLEGSFYNTALGQEIYTKKSVPLGHYHHLDAINRVRGIGSIKKAVEDEIVDTGVMRAAVKKGVPVVLAGSIRDDGPLPEVVPNVYQAQDKMRGLVKQATTVLCLATQLHSIATGNMTPSYHVRPDGVVRPVYFYSVDMSEFASNKLANRGSLSARSILTNVQDFVVTAARGLGCCG